jgi:hypothetical protein
MIIPTAAEWRVDPGQGLIGDAEHQSLISITDGSQLLRRCNKDWPQITKEVTEQIGNPLLDA